MRFFPPSIGLDISATSIKAVKLSRAKDGFFLEALGKNYLPEGVILDGEIKDSEKMLEILKSVIENSENGFAKTRHLVVSLPEERTFTRIVEMPLALKGRELDDALKWEVESNLPISLEEVYYDSEELNRDEASGHCDILVNAAPKKIVDGYVSFFAANGYKLMALEAESVAAHRALFSGGAFASETVLVMDIGAVRTRFMIVAEGNLRFTSSNSVAGDKFSQILAEQFPVNLKEAEFMKRVMGLDKDQRKGQEFLEALKPGLIMLKDQIQDYINFFETHPSKDRFHGSAQKVSRVVLTGGGAGMWGLTDWLSQELQLPVVLGDALQKIKAGRKTMSLEEALFFTTALGLALRNFEEIERI